jgi:PAS domain-containing protein
LAILAQRLGFHNVEVPLLLFAMALSAWYAGPGPAALIVGLSIVFFDYFFVEPYYTLRVSATDLPYFFVFVSFACLVAWFSAIRRRVERELIQARDSLQVEVAERTQQASLLNLTHDSIFVRDMNNVIGYWNRGAQELYGWTTEQAVGKRSHELLRTVFPNFIDLHPRLQTQLPHGVTVSTDLVVQWRENVHDGVYAVPGFPLVPAGESRARFVGYRPGVEVRWQIDRHAYLQADYGIFYAGQFLKEATPGRNLNYMAFWAGYKF